MNIRLDLAYDGTDFSGWARQPGMRTVEGVLDVALARAYDAHGRLRVAGRTDAGVHAVGQVASVEVAGGPPIAVAARVLNDLLPPDVAIHGAAAAPADFHARHSARARSYVYRTARRRTGLDARRVLHHPGPLDQDALDTCAALIVGRHDFRAFTPSETQHDDFVRTVHLAEWRHVGAERWFVITADRLLRHMVRTLVGTMLQTAAGHPRPVPFATLLEGAARSDAGVTAPPWALYLTGVRFESDPPGTELAGIARLTPPP